MTMLANMTRPHGDPKILSSGPSSRLGADRLATALGWCSFGLGLAELIAPGQVTRALGMEGREGLVRTFGVREIASGMMTLSTEKQLGLWSRVAGDGIDLLALSSAYKAANPKRDNVALALLFVAGIAALDLVGAQGVTSQHSASRGKRRSYRQRSGFPSGLAKARGAARNISRARAAYTTRDDQRHPARIPAGHAGRDLS
jgi:hypothetical protein